MISVGIDVSKGKSTVCILKPYGEIVCSPFEMQHVEKELDGLDSILRKLDGEIRITMFTPSATALSTEMQSCSSALSTGVFL